MRLLLDTHIWLWSILNPERLSRRVTKLLNTSTNEVWISPVSIWELSILARKGRVNLKMDVNEWVAKVLHSTPLREATFTNAVALAMNKIRLAHDDPADAFLAATADVFELTLVTSDEKLLAAKHISTLAND
jgi:PIN domain nuclease of toxin-antitoxin system